MPQFACAGCGAVAAADELIASRLRCPRWSRGDDVDHVLEPVARSPADPAEGERYVADDDADVDARAGNPFLRYRRRLTAWRLAMAGGLGDGAFADLCVALDRAVADLDGREFGETPFGTHRALDAALGFVAPGAVWVKDETGNVSGSHKARHLMGVMLFLQVAERLRAPRRGEPEPTLAIASCGNAALAAALVARAAGRTLAVYVPPTANARVMAELDALRADIVVCPRRAGERGDPCYRRFQQAVASGAMPFCCQGPDNALTVEGGETIVWEMDDRLDDRPLDRVFVQVGGGALASACVRGFQAVTPSAGRLPRVHAVQTAGAFPLIRAWARVALRALESLLFGSTGLDAVVPAAIRAAGPEAVYRTVLALAEAAGDDDVSLACAIAADQSMLRACADGLASELGLAASMDALRAAARHRSLFMRPWEREPSSVAGGILDDETYDWRRTVEGMLVSGGWPVIVTEAHLEAANRLARETTSIPVDHTGSAGLAGLLALGAARSDSGTPLVAADERVAVIFSGRTR
jgi:threonine synthase